MDAVAAKTCCVCKKDVSGAKRVKDTQGRYYCAPCHEALAKRTAAPPASVPPPVDDGSIDFAEPAPASRASKAPAKPIAATASASASPAKLPEVCPNCGARVFPNRKLCIKCNRDVTQIGNLVELRAKREAQSNEGERTLAIWIGRIVRVCIGIAVAAGLALVGYALYLQFAPMSIYDHYPKTREAAVRELLKDVSDGTDKSYAKAYELISFRERTLGDTSEQNRYATAFKKMHDDFAAKYGPDWNNKIKLENVGVNDAYQDDEVDFKLTLGSDTYTIATQVQIGEATAVSNMVLPRKSKPSYAQDGKLRFGILDVSQYQVGSQRRMAEKYGNQRPPTPDDLMPGNLNP